MTNANLNDKYSNTNAPNMTQQLSNMQKVRQLVKILNTGKLENVEDLIHEEYFNHESHIDVSSLQDFPENMLQQINMRNQLRGPAEFIDTVRSLRDAFTGLMYEEKEIYSDHDTVIAHYVVSGTHTGTFFAFQPTCRNFSYKAVHTYRFENSKIKEHKAIRDDLTFMLQLGFVIPMSQYESLFRLWKGIGGDSDGGGSSGDGAHLQ